METIRTILQVLIWALFGCFVLEIISIFHMAIAQAAIVVAFYIYKKL